MHIKKLTPLFEKLKNIKILVIGDIIYDHYIWGDVSRISPEAPVPVVEVKRESMMPGGAANVVNNLSSLGVQCGIIGIVGNDSKGNFLKKYFKKKKISIEGLITTKTRPTTQKTRIIAHSQQVVRIDKEDTSPLNNSEKKQIIKAIKKNTRNYNAIIIEDYGKGVIEQDIVDELIKIKTKNKIIISYDPKKGHILKIKGIDLGTPNLSEAESIIKKHDTLSLNIEDIGKLLRKKWEAKSIIITLGEKGMALFEKNKKPYYIPTAAKEVYDVSGAGDTVIAVATAMLCVGATYKESAFISNIAAGIVVEKLGTQTATKNEILSRLDQAKRL